MATPHRVPAAAPGRGSGGIRRVQYAISALESSYLLATRPSGVGKSKSGRADGAAPSGATGSSRMPPGTKIGEPPHPHPA